MSKQSYDFVAHNDWQAKWDKMTGKAIIALRLLMLLVMLSVFPVVLDTDQEVTTEVPTVVTHKQITADSGGKAHYAVESRDSNGAVYERYYVGTAFETIEIGDKHTLAITTSDGLDIWRFVVAMCWLAIGAAAIMVSFIYEIPLAFKIDTMTHVPALLGANIEVDSQQAWAQKIYRFDNGVILRPTAVSRLPPTATVAILSYVATRGPLSKHAPDLKINYY